MAILAPAVRGWKIAHWHTGDLRPAREDDAEILGHGVYDWVIDDPIQGGPKWAIQATWEGGWEAKNTQGDRLPIAMVNG